MKERPTDDFGGRLVDIRRARGLTQAELGAAAGVSERVVAYYERDDAQPPGAMLVDLAKALGVTTDELLGVKALKEQPDPKAARLVKRLRRIERLPPADQRAVLKFLDALLESKGLVGDRGIQTGA